ncbi:MAG: transcriptional regulator [Sphingomonadales bacterium]|nr:MAG: transcriptional regulator [Sphingomonadales bacterium]
MTQQDALSQTLSALADPTRRAILARLSKGAASVNEIAEPFDISLPAISRHLKVLETAGLISRGREAQWRPCQLNVEPLRDLDGWLGKYRAFWEGSFNRMDAYLKQIDRDARGDARSQTKPRKAAKKGKR